MIVKPIRNEWRNVLRTIPCAPGDGVFIESVIERPPSQAGRNCLIWIPDADIDDTLRILRDAAVARRRSTLNERSGS